MPTLSRAQQAQDQEVISRCLAKAMAASGVRAFLGARDAAATAGRIDAEREELRGRARAVRAEAVVQRDLAREMQRTNRQIVAGVRRSSRLGE